MATKVNKAKLVREAIEKLGIHAKPREIQLWLKNKGLDIPTTMISTYKNNFKKEMASGAVAQQAPVAVVNPPAPAPVPAMPADSVLSDIRVLQVIVQRHGLNTVQEMLQICGS